MRLKAHTVLVLCIGLTCSFGSALAVSDRIIEKQHYLESRVGQLARLSDPEAVALVNIEVPREKVELPGVPFYFEDYTLASDELKIERIEIKILTRKDGLPSEILKLIRESVAPYAAKADIRTVQVLDSGETSSRTLASKDTNPSLYERAKNPETYFRILAFATAAIGLYALTLLWSLMRLGKGATAISTTIANELSQLRDVSRNTAPPSESRAGLSRLPTPEGRPQLIADLPTASCLALLSDCYWCEQDQYASFLWEELSVEQRSQLLNAWPNLRNYARAFQKHSPLDLGFHRDVNYLNPLPIENVDNAALTLLMKSYPAMVFRISPMRMSGLTVTLRERADLIRQAEFSTAIPELNKLEASPARTLDTRLSIRVNSETQDAEALALREFSIELKEQFVTLAWIIQLPKDQVSALLEDFSARDLASAWVGPEKLLGFLRECLPAKKAELVDSYRATSAPSRDSDAYLRLHRRTIAALRKVQPLDPGKKGSGHVEAA